MKKKPETYIGYYCDVELPKTEEHMINNIVYGPMPARTIEFARIQHYAIDEITLLPYFMAWKDNVGYQVRCDGCKPYEIVEGKKYID